MGYTKEDYIVLEQSLKDMVALTDYFERLITKLEIECELFEESKELILDRVYDIVRHQNDFVINNWEDDVFIDVAYNNLVLSVYNDNNNCYIGENFEVWDNNNTCLIGTLSIQQVENILKSKEDMENGK